MGPLRNGTRLCGRLTRRIAAPNWAARPSAHSGCRSSHECGSRQRGMGRARSRLEPTRRVFRPRWQCRRSRRVLVSESGRVSIRARVEQFEHLARRPLRRSGHLGALRRLDEAAWGHPAAGKRPARQPADRRVGDGERRTPHLPPLVALALEQGSELGFPRWHPRIAGQIAASLGGSPFVFVGSCRYNGRASTIRVHHSGVP